MKLGSALLRALREHGAREIFGIPGDFALPFFKVIEEQEDLPLYTFSHEPAVGFAADAAARFNSTIGVAAVTYGAGAFNLVNSIAGAYAERSPVVVISGAPGGAEGLRGLGLHHQVKTLDSQYQVFSQITCDQARLDNPETAPGEIARVLRSALEQSLPVYLELPRDMVSAEVDPVAALPRRPARSAALGECADEILSRLAQAKDPVLMVGVEIRRYGIEDKVAQLARALRLPVVTTFMGRGLLADNDPPPLGTYLGVAGEPSLTGLVEGSDGLLLLGVILSDTNFAISERQIDMRRAIQALGRQVRIGYHAYPEIPLDELVDALLERAVNASISGRRTSIEASSYPHGMPADEQPILPGDIAAAVNDMMAEHGSMPMAADMGDCLFTAMEIENTQLTAPGYYAGMGYGVPAGLGIQAATGQRPLILVGDGAFQMTGWELGNCRRYGWDPIVLLFNNCSWEMLRVFQPESRFNDLDDWNFAAIAEPLGGDGRRVTTRAELKQALADAVERRGRFQLIEIMLARGKMSSTLTRFVAGVSRGH
ncbi:MAG: indolepyruvate/phenylpyruvate decarboxylase [Xanthomonadales bacterium]|nr:indolepyruvate/phenylpyruvate decarboxylase [Xanthomonadales bacterium]